MSISFKPVTRDNWEAALKLQVHPEQSKFAPSVAESLASAYIKSWDEALDPYVIYTDDQLADLFYISDTPGIKKLPRLDVIRTFDSLLRYLIEAA